jgi:hypothetical protein
MCVVIKKLLSVSVEEKNTFFLQISCVKTLKQKRLETYDWYNISFLGFFLRVHTYLFVHFKVFNI